MVTSYIHDMLAATTMKIAEAMSDQRNAPRDIYDRHDLIGVGADPVDCWWDRRRRYSPMLPTDLWRRRHMAMKRLQ
ncbi:hypothetical protein [Variovorax sp. EBFNA2]|uniref:hypothetical protein n=1 Tax=Variovorax sp. EBFNA2 TaxID=3342097 RepID=UPI0029BFFE60|nr:hypothetical protein [Variovorax boronicumulans]WPG41502.1 hypothetical protein RZE79_31825 [Variovorax boronicumulans]